MDSIEALLKDFENKKIDDKTLQGKLTELMAADKLSAKDLEQQLEQLNQKTRLSTQAYDDAKTIVANTLASDINDDKTVVVNSDATRIMSTAPTSADFDNDKTVVHTSSQQTQLNTGEDFNNVETIVAGNAQTGYNTQGGTQGTRPEHTYNYLDRNRPHESITLKTGSILKNRFILEEELGHGGMSIVYRALDLRKQEASNRNPHIAVKILGEAFKNHPQSIRVLEHETQKIQSLAHPNIITVYDFDRDGDAIYMTMECLQGESLDAVIRKNKTGLPVAQALPIIEGVSRALFYAHSKNIIHSDLKPENIFITKDNVVKVLDFGIARAKKMPEQKADGAGNLNADFDGSNLGALTPPYASPEMFENADPDPRDDIYALGCVTYKLLTGVHPFHGKQANLARDEGLVPKRINELSRKQWNTLEKSLCFERENRIASISEFLNGMVPKKRTIWFYVGLVGTSIALLISAYAWYSASQKPVIPQIKLSVEQKQQINDYLDTAQLYLSMGYLASPPGDSALDQYQKVLEIDPTNQTAIEGKKDIAKRYFTMAKQKYKNGELEESMMLAKTGLIVEPENQDLLDLQLKIHNKQNQ